MKKEDNISAQYAASKVVGRSSLCPRIGYYRILSTFQAECFGKPAEQAKVNWKESISDEYTDDVFLLQLESFKKGANPLNTVNLTSKNIWVVSASWNPLTKEFAIQWELLSDTRSLMEQANAFLANSDLPFDHGCTAEIDRQMEDKLYLERGC